MFWFTDRLSPAQSFCERGIHSSKFYGWKSFLFIISGSFCVFLPRSISFYPPIPIFSESVGIYRRLTLRWYRGFKFQLLLRKKGFLIYTGWRIKISNFSKGHCEGCSGGREVGVVSCVWLASTVVSTHNGLDRSTSGLCCCCCCCCCSLGVWYL